ncbi:DUF397 domain-containing protein [Streptomyces sp. NPDC087263]|uniref:DUF397 domain-containing protein n=1 Tax=Streptomyces sp. NPDC087263 TaxID=3365773 RepID=UPI003805BF67
MAPPECPQQAFGGYRAHGCPTRVRAVNLPITQTRPPLNRQAGERVRTGPSCPCRPRVGPRPLVGRRGHQRQASARLVVRARISRPRGRPSRGGTRGGGTMSAEVSWFKSSYSDSSGDACLEVAYTWRRSSHSDAPHAIHVRDSKPGPRSPRFRGRLGRLGRLRRVRRRSLSFGGRDPSSLCMEWAVGPTHPPTLPAPQLPYTPANMTFRDRLATHRRDRLPFAATNDPGRC